LIYPWILSILWSGNDQKTETQEIQRDQKLDSLKNSHRSSKQIRGAEAPNMKMAFPNSTEITNRQTEDIHSSNSPLHNPHPTSPSHEFAPLSVVTRLSVAPSPRAVGSVPPLPLPSRHSDTSALRKEAVKTRL
jgi:hypothetical protein